MKKKIEVDLRYVVFAILLLVVYVMVFLVPGSQKTLSLDPHAEGEYWRWATYQFTHLDWNHLIQNIVTLGLVSFVAIELKSKFKFFSTNYFLVGLVAILPLWIVSPFVALGASAAIFGSFGFISPETEKFKINMWLVSLVIVAFIFIKPILVLVGAMKGDLIVPLKQALAHFSGFVFGMMGFYFFKIVDKFLLKRKQHVLRKI